MSEGRRPDPLSLFARLPAASVSEQEIDEMVQRVRLLRQLKEQQAAKLRGARPWMLGLAAALLLLATALPRLWPWRSGESLEVTTPTPVSAIAHQRDRAAVGQTLASLPLVEELDTASPPAVYQITEEGLDLVMIVGEGLDL